MSKRGKAGESEKGDKREDRKNSQEERILKRERENLIFTFRAQSFYLYN